MDQPRRTVRDSRFWQAYRARRYTILFYASLAMIVVLPLASTFGFPVIAIRLLLGGCLLAAVMPSSTRRTRVGLALSVIGIVAVRLLSERNDVPIAAGLMVAVVGLAGLLAAAGTSRFVVMTRAVDGETVHAALSTYLLAGLFFGQIYLAIDRTWPGSISTHGGGLDEASAVYYSFVTLATLGYGDIVPKSDLARGVAVFEVIGGQLFLAVMVARLIGLFGGRSRDL